MAANPGDFWNWRRANFKSFMAKVMDERKREWEARLRSTVYGFTAMSTG
jgi:hypothetical protein